MKIRLLLPALIAAAILPASACDLCPFNTTSHDWDPSSGFYLGLAEQFTRFTTLQHEGHKIPNDASQKLESSITQLFLGYNFSPKLGFQINVPLIHRSFRRLEEGAIQTGSVSGMGDASLLLQWSVFSHEDAESLVLARLGAGIKLPTGDSARLAEEASESETSAVHGHELALGSGSVDAILNADFVARRHRAFFAAGIQYNMRTEGDFDYRFGNDFFWNAGPGFFLSAADSHTLALQFVCSAETKTEDYFRGQRAEDTAATSVFLGPRIRATWQKSLTADLSLELPVHSENSATQLLPDYRLRASFSWTF